MYCSRYQDLKVWQKSMDLVMEVYSLTKLLPKEELYGLSNQMKRAAVSIPSNIAEGQQRGSKRDFAKFLIIARGSNAELQTQLMICERLDYLYCEQTEKAMALTHEISKMLSALILHLAVDNC